MAGKSGDYPASIRVHASIRSVQTNNADVRGRSPSPASRSTSRGGVASPLGMTHSQSMRSMDSKDSLTSPRQPQPKQADARGRRTESGLSVNSSTHQREQSRDRSRGRSRDRSRDLEVHSHTSRTHTSRTRTSPNESEVYSPGGRPTHGASLHSPYNYGHGRRNSNSISGSRTGRDSDDSGNESDEDRDGRRGRPKGDDISSLPASIQKLQAPSAEVKPKKKEVSAEEMKTVRDKVLAEMLETERTYVKEMKSLCENYLIPIMTKSMLPDGSAKCMLTFTNAAKAILKLHQDFLNDLNAKWLECGSNQDLLDLLVGCVEAFSLYFPYVQNYPALNIDFNDQANSKLMTFLATTARNHGHLGITQLLILPIQRIPRYQLLLERLKEHTSEDDPSWEPLKALLRKLKDRAQKVDSCCRQSESSAMLFDLSNKVSHIPDDWRILEPHRCFLGEADVIRVFGRTELALDKPPTKHPYKANRGESVRLLLFNDAILLTSWEYKYRQRIDLEHLKLEKRGVSVLVLITDPLANDVEATINPVLLFDNPGALISWEKRITDAVDDRERSLVRLVRQGMDDKKPEDKTVKYRETHMMEKVNLYLRVRPFINKEEKDDGRENLKLEGQIATLVQLGTSRSPRVCIYDRVFVPNCTQDDVFEEVGHENLGAIFAGYNVAIFAYGATGSGKTYTMLGDTEHKEQMGLIPRLVREVFAGLSASVYENTKVSISYMQVYNDRIQDLQGPWKKVGDPLPEIEIKRAKETKNGPTYTLHGLVETPVTSLPQALNIISEGNKRRSTRSHKMNEMSSRSHAIFVMSIEFKRKGTDKLISSTVHLIDLAGSENEHITGVDGDALTESRYINNSLVSLGRVVNAINENKRRTKGKRIAVPFRETKLTHLLTDVLSGEFLCSIILNVSSSPANGQTELTAKTMTFGDGVKKLSLHAKKNEKDVALSNWLMGVWKSASKTK